MAASHAHRLSTVVVASTGGRPTLAPTAPVAAGEPEPPGDCTDTLTASQLTSGEMGTGWTVSRGRDPQPFAIEVLGVVSDGIAPGRDLIVVETSGAAIDKVGGIWFGMSGSPVFVERDGEPKLIGAVAYGFSFGPSPIAGLTPAADLVGVANRSVSGPSSPAPTEPVTAALDPPTRRAIADELGLTTAEVDREMHRLTVPLALGAHPVRAEQLTEKLQQRARRADVRILPYTVGTSSSAGTGSGTLAAGDNFAGVLSYGDLPAAGIGTTSYVCDGRAVAFGHPFFFDGPTTMGANAAEALTIVGDPVFGPFKFATVAESVGTVDQDRLGGIRALLGAAPPSVPITSSVSELDEGHERDGRTDVVFTDVVEDVALFHTMFSIDSVFDRIGGGSSQVRTTISGTRAGETPWSLETTNRFASSWDIAWVSVFELYFDLLRLHRNDVEPVEIDTVHVDVEVEGTTRTYELRRVLVSSNGVDFVPLEEAALQAGRTELLRAVLRRVDRRHGKLLATPAEVEVDLALAIPRHIHGPHVLEVRAGQPGDEDPFDCLFDPDECGPAASLSLDDVISAIEARPRNDDLVARLRPFDDEDDGEEFDEPGSPPFDHGSASSSPPLAEARERLDRAGSGSVITVIDVEPLPTAKPAYVRGNRWRLRSVLTEGAFDIAFRFGRSTDVQLLCDWTGRGSSPVVFRDGTWYAKASQQGGEADRTFRFGRKGDVPVCGDWNGNGKESPGVVRGRTWLLRNSMRGGAAHYEFRFGRATDVKIVGDWNGNGRDTPGLRRGTEWRLRNRLTSGNSTIVFDFGSRRGQPVVGDWNANGKDGVGVVVDGRWRLRNSLRAGKTQVSFDFGGPGDRFLTWRPPRSRT